MSIPLNVATVLRKYVTLEVESLDRMYLNGLVAKIPRSRRWRVTAFGHRIMSASVRLRQLHFPTFYAEAA